MKLNADLLYRELKRKYKTVMRGPYDEGLVLSRPEFYMDGEDSFLKNRLYLATAEHLPRRPEIQRGAVLVCIGDAVHLRYYEERLCLITIRSKADFFRVYQMIQSIYDRYDEWERELYRDLMEGADVKKIIAECAGIFEKPVFLLDSSFRYLASAGAENAMPSAVPTDAGFLNSESLSTFMSSSRMMTEKHGQIRIDLEGSRTLCVNLFDRDGVYAGCLFILQGDEEFSSGEGALAEFLASMLEKAIEKDPEVFNDEQASVKSVIRTLIEEQPISASQRILLSASNHRTAYICVFMQFTDRYNRIPLGYVCDVFEETFPHSAALKREEGMICFMDVQKYAAAPLKELKEKAGKELQGFAGAMHLQAGVSDMFTDLFNIRLHYRQALAALENGRLMEPGKTVYYFSDHALDEMILNALGDMPAEAYFPKGLKEILNHDESSGVSYLETLKIFLEENMSFTSAARRLYIHRSTLIDRIARIEKDLEIDLNDCRQRLLMEIILRAMEIEKTLEHEKQMP